MPELRADLHMHTDASDGTRTPAQLLAEARDAGLTHLAITDHDTMDGTTAARDLMADHPGLTLITGVELTMKGRNCHLLAYGRAMTAPMAEKMAELRAKRIERANKILDLLEADGMPLDREAVLSKPSGYVGLSTIGRAMVKAGYILSEGEAFMSYIGNGCKYYISSERMSLLEAIPFLREAGFVPVLAHPMEMPLSFTERNDLIRAAVKAGLMGIEVWHPANHGHHDELRRLADELGLLVTGGSDFHGDGDAGHGGVGCMADRWTTVDEDLPRLLEAIECA